MTTKNGREDGPRPLPEPVRAKVITLAAEALGLIPSEAVPPSLKRVASFAPHRRARLAGGHIAAALETDEQFRTSIAMQYAPASQIWWQPLNLAPHPQQRTRPNWLRWRICFARAGGSQSWKLPRGRSRIIAPLPSSDATSSRSSACNGSSKTLLGHRVGPPSLSP